MYKTLIILLSLFIFCGCGLSQLQKECEQVKGFLWEDETCPSGWTTPGITGHPPICLSVEDCKKLEEHCGVYFRCKQ